MAAEAAAEDLVPQVLWRCAACRVHARRGDPERASTLAAEALLRTEGVEFPFLQVAALTAAAEAETAAGGFDAARRLLEDARSLMAAKGNLPEAARLAELGGTSADSPIA